MNVSILFSDSYAHLSTSLDTAVKSLAENGSSAFPAVRKFVEQEHGGSEVKLKLLLRKGVYPYDYFTRIDRFKEGLPPQSEFYNSLTNEKCSDEDYLHVLNVWNTFGMKTLADLCELYVKSDVLLLSDVITQYREESLESYGLDPLHYFSAPG